MMDEEIDNRVQTNPIEQEQSNDPEVVVQSNLKSTSSNPVVMRPRIKDVLLLKRQQKLSTSNSNVENSSSSSPSSGSLVNLAAGANGSSIVATKRAGSSSSISSNTNGNVGSGSNGNINWRNSVANLAPSQKATVSKFYVEDVKKPAKKAISFSSVVRSPDHDEMDVDEDREIDEEESNQVPPLPKIQSGPSAGQIVSAKRSVVSKSLSNIKNSNASPAVGISSPRLAPKIARRHEWASLNNLPTSRSTSRVGATESEYNSDASRPASQLEKIGEPAVVDSAISIQSSEQLDNKETGSKTSAATLNNTPAASETKRPASSTLKSSASASMAGGVKKTLQPLNFDNIDKSMLMSSPPETAKTNQSPASKLNTPTLFRNNSQPDSNALFFYKNKAAAVANALKYDDDDDARSDTLSMVSSSTIGRRKKRTTFKKNATIRKDAAGQEEAKEDEGGVNAKLDLFTTNEEKEEEDPNAAKEEANKVIKYPATTLQEFYFSLCSTSNEYIQEHQKDNSQEEGEKPNTLQRSFSSIISSEVAQDLEIKRSLLFLHQGYTVPVPSLDTLLLEKIAHIMILEFPILRTKFFQNALIIDADLEAHLCTKAVYQAALQKFIWKEESSSISGAVEEEALAPPPTIVLNTTLEEEFSSVEDGRTTLETCQSMTKDWVRKADPSKELIKLLVFQSTNPNEKNSFVTCVMSKLIADQKTGTWFSQLAILLYEYLTESMNWTGSSPISFEDFYKCVREKLPIESTDFIDYSMLEKRQAVEKAASAGSVSSVHFWYSLLTENLKDHVVDQSIIEASMGRLRGTVKALTNLRDTSQKRKVELETILMECVEQRKKLNKYEGLYSDDPSTGFVNNIPVNNMITSSGADASKTPDSVSEEAVKLELMNVILKEEFGSNNLNQVLESQGLSVDTILKNRWNTISLVSFSQLDDERLDALPARLLTREKKKVKSLATFLRNRLRSCLEEQSRIKFNLERKIAKTRRELHKFTESSKKYQHELDMAEDTLIKYTQLLNPRTLEIAIPECRLSYDINMSLANTLSRAGVSMKDLSGKSLANLNASSNNMKANLLSMWTISDLTTTVRSVYDWYTFEIDASTTADIKKFLKEWHLLHNLGGTTSEGSNMFQRSGSNILPRGDLDTVRLQLSDSVNLMEAILICTFSVLAKHICGFPKFLLGLENSSRSFISMSGLMAGPLSSVIPFMVDCSEPDLNFQDLFNTVVKGLRHLSHHRHQGLEWINEFVVKTRMQDLDNIESTGPFTNPLELPIRLEYVSSQEYQRWSSCGLNDMDILGLEDHENRVWIFDPAQDYNLKVSLINKDDTMLFCFRYRKDEFSSSDIKRWSEKLTSIFECIESGPKKVKLSNIVSRFYHSAFSLNVGMSEVNLAKTTSRASLANLFTTS